MQFWQFMFVPTILFLVIVAPIWITMHYRSVNRSSQSLSAADRQDLEDLLATVDRLTERIGALETILDADHSTWRKPSERAPRNEEYNDE
ncbi:MAG: envelope stress response membrane protein PspB [Haliea sp.]|jgi:phage shock protein B|uniref:envelope stress response membrane protein PspB n=1 Tax=Haliea sp. TaxID=1932666 RepID=UPI000C5008D1|nr:envelope stress response membrane protein PspB [Haliea sp.]MBM70023.1 envelope stress response membrane protein PspB [Haliea sp.]|tara:strand:- start:49271 stop:49540 length:270 start_codon:yes stop_codon:yes gene_type:complete